MKWPCRVMSFNEFNGVADTVSREGRYDGITRMDPVRKFAYGCYMTANAVKKIEEQVIESKNRRN